MGWPFDHLYVLLSVTEMVLSPLLYTGGSAMLIGGVHLGHDPD